MNRLNFLILPTFQCIMQSVDYSVTERVYYLLTVCDRKPKECCFDFNIASRADFASSDLLKAVKLQKYSQ